MDDDSSDDTVERVHELLTKHERIRLIRLSRPFGQEVAIAAGLDSVIGDFVVVMLPASDPPSLVPEMIALARGGAETVYGVRQDRKTDPVFIRLGAKIFYWYCNRALKLDLPPNSTHLRVLSRRVVNALVRIKERGRYLRTLGQHVGYLSLAFPYDLIQRRNPPRTKGLFEAFQLALAIVVSNTLTPLRIVTWVGLLLALSNLFYAGYWIGAAILGLATPLGVAQSVHVGIMFFFLFSILAVSSEYLGRIVEAGQGRPLYYVLDEKRRCCMVPTTPMESASYVFGAKTQNQWSQ